MGYSCESPNHDCCPCLSRTRITDTTTNLCLQFLLQLPQKPPIGALSDNLLRTRFNHSRLLEAQRVKADAVLGVVIAPLAVRNLLHSLKSVVVIRGKALVDEQARGALRLHCTDLVRF